MGYLSIGGTTHKHQENAMAALMPARKTTFQHSSTHQILQEICSLYMLLFIVFHHNSLPVVY